MTESGGVATHTLVILLVILLFVSSFFSAAETGMMAINRYRLKHASKTNRTARLVLKMLTRSDRLLTVVLIGNNFANVAIASLGTIIGMRIAGDFGGVMASLILGIVIVLFVEITPKIIASQIPEQTSYLVAKPLYIVTILLFPLVWVSNLISGTLVRLIRGQDTSSALDILTMEELRTVVNESSALIPSRHKTMLTSIFDLEEMTVNDIMVPRSDITGIDLNSPQEEILRHIRTSQHTIMPVYQGDIDNILGVLHMRDLSHQLTEHDFSKALIQQLVETPYFVPEGAPLHTQLLNFQINKHRFGLIVDEYGDIIGLITLADILEQIVGEFTTDIHQNARIIPQEDKSYLIDGSVNIRVINQNLDWNLPITGAKTLNGIIIEYLEVIPASETCVLINNHPIEIIKVQDNTIKLCKVWPQINPSLHSSTAKKIK